MDSLSLSLSRVLPQQPTFSLAPPSSPPAGRPALPGPAVLHEALYNTRVFYDEIRENGSFFTAFFNKMTPDSCEKGGGVTAATRLETAAF